MDGAKSPIATLDTLVAGFFAGWDSCSTLIVTLIVVVLGYSFFFTGDEDIHPYFLARQASESSVRREDESATYRNLDTPHGYPLRRGLDIKSPDAPKWTSGRSGDLRDIWLAFANGSAAVADKKHGQPAVGNKSEIYTVLGRFVKAHSVEEITRQIDLVGKQLTGDLRGETIVACLSSSIELLALVFASSFYGFKVVLVPSDVSAKSLGETVQNIKADTLIAEAGGTNLLELLKHTQLLHKVIWVTRGGSDDVDWAAAPNIGHDLRVTTWFELVKDGSSAGLESLLAVEGVTPPPITTFWSKSDGSGILVEYDQQNLVSGTAGIIAGLTKRQRLTSSDNVLIADHLSHPYPLAVLLAALYSNASVSLGSVAGNRVNLALASEAVSPTVIVASSDAVSQFYTDYLKPSAGIITQIGCLLRRISLNRGVFPSPGGWVTLMTSLSLAPNTRLLLISRGIDDGKRNGDLEPKTLSSLRTILNVRVVYALTAPYVFGAVCQTNPVDYRRVDKVHFGPPVSSIELKVVGGKAKGDGEKVVEGTPRGTASDQAAAMLAAVNLNGTLKNGTFTMPVNDISKPSSSPHLVTPSGSETSEGATSSKTSSDASNATKGDSDKENISPDAECDASDAAADTDAPDHETGQQSISDDITVKHATESRPPTPDTPKNPPPMEEEAAAATTDSNQAIDDNSAEDPKLANARKEREKYHEIQEDFLLQYSPDVKRGPQTPFRRASSQRMHNLGESIGASKYAGRSLSEWAHVVNECDTHYERRREAGIATNRMVEIPSLGVENLRR
ncbi:hypothetical protein KEM56_000679 [Ascosphaera pollenicola]|nr:hypothetical protein KEM56_000679 [Ascosphaera pollenicola]